MAPEDDEAESDREEDVRFVDCRPDSDEDDNDAYEFLPDGDDPPIGAAEKECNILKKSPFLQLNMGGYTLHPRLRSLTVAQKDESEDPVNHHIAAAEALFREGFQV